MVPRQRRASSDKITYKIAPPFFIIQFNSPETYNAFSYDDYIYLTTVLEISSASTDCFFTVLQSSGNFFSSGADFNYVPDATEVEGQGIETKSKTTQLWLENFLCKNQYITQSFIRHEKILIACLNGPAIGLSAAIVLLCDLVYCMDLNRVFLQFPFSKLGLSNEGAVSSTLPMKLGRNRSFEKLLFAQKVEGKELENNVILKTKFGAADILQGCNGDKTKAVEVFNELMIKELKNKCESVYLPTLLEMKKLFKSKITDTLEVINSKEVHSGLPFWVNGIPQTKFTELRNLKRQKAKSKL